jgi:hypothetical protein
LKNKRESNAAQDAIDALQKLINKEKSEDLEMLRSDLRILRDLIPYEITEEKSFNGRKLTSAEMKAYEQNKDATDEKELDLLKEILKQE